MPAMRAADLMTRHVEFIGRDATVQQAAEMMGELDVGALPVGSEVGLDGIVTDRDILYRVVAAGLNPAATSVQQVMTHPVVGCSEDDTIQAVLDMMASHHIRRMPVFGPPGAVAGWLTLADISRRLLVDSHMIQNGLRGLTEAG